MKKTLIFIASIMIVLTATAAAADFHVCGYDESCLLCQVNHLPLLEMVTTPFIPESPLIFWWSAGVNCCRQMDQPFTLATGRAPPFIH